MARFLTVSNWRVVDHYDAGCFCYSILEWMHTASTPGPFFWWDSFGTFTQIIPEPRQ